MKCKYVAASAKWGPHQQVIALDALTKHILRLRIELQVSALLGKVSGLNLVTYYLKWTPIFELDVDLRTKNCELGVLRDH